MSLSTQIQTVNDKLQQLLKQYQAVLKENQHLTKENLQLKEQLEQKNRLSQQLQQKMEAAKLTSGDMDDTMKKDLEKRINSYLKEIDKCLNMLNN